MTEVSDWTRLLGAMPVTSSHCHHGSPEQHAGMNLDKLLGSSYVGWCGPQPGNAGEERERFIDQVGSNTYFVWLSRSLAELYGQGEITPDTWDAISSAIASAHTDPEHHFRLLSERCRYRFAVQDSYWSPGDDLGRPDLFRPTYRINSWAMCYRPGVVDHNDNSPWHDPEFDPATLDEYLDLLGLAIQRSRESGAVALKSALAYDRPVAFDNPDLEAARRAFRAEGEVSRGDRLAFGDVVFHRVCQLAQKLGMPVQVHLGLGIIASSRPMLFEPIIAAYPSVTFDLFHGGYPWCSEIGGLLHNYANVVADLCWLPLISTTTAVSALHEYLDVAQSSDRIIWGDDTWTGEEAYGALLAWEYVVGRVLSERVSEGLSSVAQAEHLAEKLMYANGERLFGSG